MLTKEEILNTFASKEGVWWAYKEGIQIGYNEAFNSLRNQAAIAAMQGLLSNSGYVGSVDECVRVSINHANKLIEQLKEK